MALPRQIPTVEAFATTYKPGIVYITIDGANTFAVGDTVKWSNGVVTTIGDVFKVDGSKIHIKASNWRDFVKGSTGMDGIKGGYVSLVPENVPTGGSGSTTGGSGSGGLGTEPPTQASIVPSNINPAFLVIGVVGLALIGGIIYKLKK